MSLPSPPAIRVQHLSKRYGNLAVVQDVSFELAAGETLVLLGPSGCGKTTLLKMLNRLIEPSDGSVEVNGQDVRAQKPEELRRGMGYVIQQVGLLPHYTVAENVGIVPRLLGQDPATITQRTTALLTRLHLPPERFANQYPQQLSGGQQQRVGLARALAADPPIILLDEPFGALDPITRASIRREFRELDELRRKTVVLVTHDVIEAFELADRIALLDAGKIQQLGTSRELLFQPANAFVRRFFAAERLSLQLRTLRLADVLPFVPESRNHSNTASSPIMLQPSATIQEALEHLTNENTTGSNAPNSIEVLENGVDNQTLSVNINASPTNKYQLDLPRLMSAFGEALQREEAACKR
ncbi:ABC transporter ATP-binding protein [Hymenobacter sp. GOD-10R]|uniref:ABC transporter ATP-binding protein n=1 Tax=Hymenobacter sp. GOD-10R TaxID=3093922 RepID=UPI002D79F46B|nr:ATP-binding cassette domain-containing protein [Hymenobacter sp. GOD-10R]WRQ26438.1 ATP-binding cassette domain-containing protein [Hymenobacter sp. GOD-10R]